MLKTAVDMTILLISYGGKALEQCINLAAKRAELEKERRDDDAETLC